MNTTEFFLSLIQASKKQVYDYILENGFLNNKDILVAFLGV